LSAGAALHAPLQTFTSASKSGVDTWFCGVDQNTVGGIEIQAFKLGHIRAAGIPASAIRNVETAFAARAQLK
jgi:hypothetical protein